MASQNKLCIPKRELGLNYPASLHNFLLRIYEVKNLNVSIMSLYSLENLTKTKRNVLQSIDNQIAKSFIPTVFHHNIKTYDGRKRISNKFLTASAAQLLDAMNKSFDFLSTNKWKGYHTYLSHLYDTTLLCVEKMKVKSNNRNVDHYMDGKLDDGKQLNSYKTVEAIVSHQTGTQYLPLLEKLDHKEDYEFIFVTCEDIDNWHPSPSVGESLGTKRQRHHQFRIKLQFHDTSISTFNWLVGGRN